MVTSGCRPQAPGTLVRRLGQWQPSYCGMTRRLCRWRYGYVPHKGAHYKVSGSQGERVACVALTGCMQ